MGMMRELHERFGVLMLKYGTKTCGMKEKERHNLGLMENKCMECVRRDQDVYSKNEEVTRRDGVR